MDNSRDKFQKGKTDDFFYLFPLLAKFDFSQKSGSVTF